MTAKRFLQVFSKKCAASPIWKHKAKIAKIFLLSEMDFCQLL